MITNRLMGAFVAVAALVAGAIATPAAAVPLSGTIGYVGGVNGGQDLTTITTVQFKNPFFVVNSQDDLAALAGATGTIKNLTFSPFTAIQDFLTFSSGLNFDLQTLTFERKTTAAGNEIDFQGTGRFQMAGFDDTFGTFIMTLQDDMGRGLNISFSASSETGEGGGGPNLTVQGAYVDCQKGRYEQGIAELEKAPRSQGYTVPPAN